MRSMFKTLNGHTKEVRFSSSAAPVRQTRARSLATSDPLLDHSSSIHTKESGAIAFPDFVAYADHSRWLLENQRAAFDRERAIFSEERKLWNAEREALNARIAELESMRNDSDRKDNYVSSQDRFRPIISWQESCSVFQPKQHCSNNGYHVWQGPNPGSKPSRVFPDEKQRQAVHFPSADENGFGPPPSLDAALSPEFRAVDRSPAASVPIPIEKLDSNLDGITLKSTALPPDIVARVVTPPSPRSLGCSPVFPEAQRPRENRSMLKLKLSDLGPPDENLTRDAGHTPMAILAVEIQASRQSPIMSAAEEESPLAPVSALQPVESSESYFPVVEDDPALKAPFFLPNQADKDDGFLSGLNERLLDEAWKALQWPSASQGDSDGNVSVPDQGEEPELKLKDAMNFGTAFGTADCGNA
jgi:hypothetical protein